MLCNVKSFDILKKVNCFNSFRNSLNISQKAEFGN